MSPLAPGGPEGPGVRSRRSRSEAGRAGEDAAAAFLEAEGWKIAARNFRWRRGEIDIAATKEGVIAFVEVKSWDSFGSDQLERAIGPAKRRKIVETAKIFLSRYREYSSCSVRFDVVLVRAGEVRQCYRSAFTGEL